ncbi:hypothetical protein B0H16DRAFT_1316373 [Mycena metata]|uniref:Uncharacterized protein n=1 Tax=Mycena metata TaxID=1033252 RepID=A0AAD7J0Z6_9AGAR|nr:hypothetical protein B0H16DRAFT_1316373 [Mycena metata]
MNPEEIETLRVIGLDLVGSFVAIVNETAWLVVYAVLVLNASTTLLRKEGRSRSSLLTWLAILVMFMITVVLWALDMTTFIMQVKLTLVVNPELSLGTRFANAQSFIFPLIAAIDALYAYLSILGDAIIIWRVWKLKGYYHAWVFVLPLALLLGSIISAIMLTYCVAAIGSDLVLGTFQKPPFCRGVQITTFAMACATTTCATVLIWATTWNYRHSIKPMLVDSFLASDGSTTRRKRSQVETVLVLLLESGLLYFLFFAIQLVGDIPQVKAWIQSHAGVSFAWVVYSYCCSVIVGIYPTAIIVLVQSRHGVLDKAAAASVLASKRHNTTSRAPWSISLDDIEVRPEITSSHDLNSSHNRHIEPHKPADRWEGSLEAY